MLDSLEFTLPKIITGITAGTVFAVLFGSPSPLLLALFILFFLDAITGIWAAIQVKVFTSHRMRKGITKFLAYTISIIVAAQFSSIPFLFWLEDAILAFLAITELSSIGENFKKLGFYFPSFSELQGYLKKSKKG